MAHFITEATNVEYLSDEATMIDLSFSLQGDTKLKWSLSKKRPKSYQALIDKITTYIGENVTCRHTVALLNLDSTKVVEKRKVIEPDPQHNS